MSEWLEKFTTYADGTKVHLLTHIFFYITAIYGIGLGFFGWTESIKVVVLYTASTNLFGSGIVSIWGFFAFGITLLNTIALVFRLTKMAPVTAMLGFCVWIYAIVIYATGAYWFQFLVGALPNMAFWAWYYHRSIQVRNRVYARR